MLEQKKDRPFYFFEVFADTFFVAITGIFATLFLIFLTLSVTFLKPIYNQTTFFSLLGALFFFFSSKNFLKRNRSSLRNITYRNFLEVRKQLFIWILWTFNFYLMTCWFLLILIGTTNGFGLKFPIASQASQAILVSGSAQTTKLTGLVLWIVHLFLIVLFKIIGHYWARIFNFAHTEFEKRRKNLELVRSKANLGG